MKHIVYICVLILTSTGVLASGTLFFPPKGIDFEELKKQKLIKYCIKKPEDNRCKKLTLDKAKEGKSEVQNE